MYGMKKVDIVCRINYINVHTTMLHLSLSRYLTTSSNPIPMFSMEGRDESIVIAVYGAQSNLNNINENLTVGLNGHLGYHPMEQMITCLILVNLTSCKI